MKPRITVTRVDADGRERSVDFRGDFPFGRSWDEMRAWKCETCGKLRIGLDILFGDETYAALPKAAGGTP